MKNLLKSLDACGPARDWVGDKSSTEAWETCERADWMLWLLAMMADKPGWPTAGVVRHCACDCAYTALRFVPYGEGRPARAVAVARLYADGLATGDDLAAARGAAYAAGNAAYATGAAAHDAYAAGNAAYAAGNAAYAAGNAAYAAGDAAYDAYAAWDVAWAAAHAARDAAMKSVADLIRKRVPTIPEVV